MALPHAPSKCTGTNLQDENALIPSHRASCYPDQPLRHTPSFETITVHPDAYVARGKTMRLELQACVMSDTHTDAQVNRIRIRNVKSSRSYDHKAPGSSPSANQIVKVKRVHALDKHRKMRAAHRCRDPGKGEREPYATISCSLSRARIPISIITRSTRPLETCKSTCHTPCSV